MISFCGMSMLAKSNGPNLYLIGFMGVGKSAVGRGVARVLGMEFVDSDHAIERAAGITISEMFAQFGEAHFRERERAFIEEGHAGSGLVVSCGGGLPLQPGMRERLLEKGVVVCLFASVETILSRTLGNDKRPLLQAEDPEKRVRTLLAEREPVYLQTGIGVSTEGRSLNEVAASVARIYRREARRRERRV